MLTCDSIEIIWWNHRRTFTTPHLFDTKTGDPPEMAVWAAVYLAVEPELLLTDLVVAETVYVIESFYEAPREKVAQAIRSLLAL